uniref:Uncharacterized protein n=1 Tax=Anguilla anguilla TaxID=7936 RepID=A0A0E9UGN8_ANGAN
MPEYTRLAAVILISRVRSSQTDQIYERKRERRGKAALQVQMHFSSPPTLTASSR